MSQDWSKLINLLQEYYSAPFSKQNGIYSDIIKELNISSDEKFKSLISSLLRIKDATKRYKYLTFISLWIFTSLDGMYKPTKNINFSLLMTSFTDFMSQVSFIYSSQFEKSFYTNYQEEIMRTLEHLLKNNELLSFKNSTPFKKLLEKTNEIHREAERLKPELITSNGYY